MSDVTASLLPRIGRVSRLLLVLATAAGYVLVAWAGLSLLTSPSGLTIFWPALGLSAGLAIAIGRRGYWPIALGTFLGSVVVGLLIRRDVMIAAGIGLLNAGSIVLMARILEFVPEQTQAARRLMRALAFFGSAIISTAIVGLGAALLVGATTLSGETTTLIDAWRNWSFSSLVGILVVAPLIIAFHELVIKPELRKTYDWTADAAVLVPFVLVAYHTLGIRLDDHTWMSIVPGAAILPLLLWISARSQPTAPALAILLLAVMIAWFAATGSGRYGDGRLEVETRILAAQVALGTATVVAQVVMALYTDRRLAVGRLKDSETRLAAIVDTAPGVIFSVEAKPDGTLSFPFVSSTSSEMLGIAPDLLAAEPSKLLDQLAPRDRSVLLAALRDADGSEPLLSVELPLRRGTSHEAWIEIKARPDRQYGGSVVWHGFIQDITLRRRLAEEMGHRTRNLLSITQSIAEHTARHTSPDDLPDVLAERLSALAASHGLLAAHQWEGAELGPLATSQLSHLSDLFDQRLMITGSRVLLRPQAAQIIGMAIHELATNACKYGALANDHGTVRLSWTLPEEHRDGVFAMCWHEQGGNPLPRILRKGFGSKITLDMLATHLEADVSRASGDEGLVWSLTAPARTVIGAKDLSGERQTDTNFGNVNGLASGRNSDP